MHPSLRVSAFLLPIIVLLLARPGSAEMPVHRGSEVHDRISGPILGDPGGPDRSEPAWVGDLAWTAGGVLLCAAGITYWARKESIDDAAQRQGVRPVFLAVAASVAIPVGAVTTVFAGAAAASEFGRRR